MPGTYDKVSKTIQVMIPEGRQKPSGVRGKQFRGYQLWAFNGYKKVYMTYRAVSEENARKQHIKACKEMGYTPIVAPEGKIEHIYR